MKILHVAETRSDRSSGISVYVLGLLNALAQRGRLELALLPTQPDVDPLGTDRVPGVMLLPPPRRPSPLPWGGDAAKLDEVEAVFGRPDLLHFHGVYRPYHVALAAQALQRGLPYIVSGHGGLQESAQSHKHLKKSLANGLFFSSYLRRARALVATGPEERLWLKRHCPGVPLLTHPNALAEAVFASAQAVPPPPPRAGRPFTAGYIGRLDTHHKGLDLLLLALGALERMRPELDLRLELFGPFHAPGDEAALRGLAARLRHPERVRFPGPRHADAKLRALADLDLFVQTSRYEGMPAGVLEAMAAARPCLLTPGTNLTGLLRDADGGWSCAPEPAAVATALAAAAKEPPERLRERGERLRRLVSARHSWDAAASLYESDVRALAF